MLCRYPYIHLRDLLEIKDFVFVEKHKFESRFYVCSLKFCDFFSSSNYLTD